MSGLHVVLGSSGGAGRAVVRELSGRGTRVRAISRSGRGDALSGVEHVRGDASDPTSLIALSRGAAVIYHCVNVPYPQWLQRLEPIARAVIEAATAAGARLVVMDNLYMYGPVDEPMTEATPRWAQGRKGRLRVRLEELFLDAHRAGKVRVAIGRASDYYGPAANSPANILAIKPALAGRTAYWLGNLDAPHTLSYLPDVGRGLVTLGERDAALGEIWHLPAAAPVTGRAFLQMLFEALGRPPRMRVMPRAMLRLAGIVSPLVREESEVLYQFERPFIMDTSKFERAFGGSVTSHREAIAQTISAMRG